MPGEPGKAPLEHKRRDALRVSRGKEDRQQPPGVVGHDRGVLGARRVEYRQHLAGMLLNGRQLAKVQRVR